MFTYQQKREFKNGADDLTKLSTLFSGVLIICQLVLDFIVHWGNYYFDYLKLTVERDIETSLLLKIVKPLKTTEQLLAAGAYKIEGYQRYTDQEMKMLNEINKNGDKYKEEYDRNTKMVIKKNAGRLVVGVRDKIKGKTITNAFKKNQKNAAVIINQPSKLDEILKNAEDFASKLPAGIDEFISFFKQYSFLESIIDGLYVGNEKYKIKIRDHLVYITNNKVCSNDILDNFKILMLENFRKTKDDFILEIFYILGFSDEDLEYYN